MSPEAQRIWNLSDEYVPLAVANLTQPQPKPEPGGYSYHPEIVRIVFLFPDLAETFRGKLLELRVWQLLSGHAQQSEKEIKGQQTAHQAEFFEAEFASLVTEVSDSLPHLTPIQQEILREKYLKDLGPTPFKPTFPK